MNSTSPLDGTKSARNATKDHRSRSLQTRRARHQGFPLKLSRRTRQNLQKRQPIGRTVDGMARPSDRGFASYGQ